MKSNYYVNQIAQSTGDHEVHKETCPYLPSSQDRKYLGEFETCHGAVKKPKNLIILRMDANIAHQIVT